MTRPRLRHCTMIERNDTDTLLIVVGRDQFELTETSGNREMLLRLKSHMDGRYPIEAIAKRTGIARADVHRIVTQFEEMGLLRTESEQDEIAWKDFVQQIRDTAFMWSRQIGYHNLFGGLERGEYRREVLIGLIIETHHYVKAAPAHISCALQSAPEALQPTFLSYLRDETGHEALLANTLSNLGIPASVLKRAHPLIGTLSLIQMLCDIGRKNPLSYLSCTTLFEARPQDVETAIASWKVIAQNYDIPFENLKPMIDHLLGDVAAEHTDLLGGALPESTTIPPDVAHEIVNNMHDLKHAFDQYHDQIIQYYSDISNYIPRPKVDWFSL